MSKQFMLAVHSVVRAFMGGVVVLAYGNENYTAYGVNPNVMVGFDHG